MTKIRIPYYVIAKGRGYWRPHPRMRRFGFSLVRCGKDGPEAWAIAESWNQKWQAFRKGQIPAPIEASKLSRDDAEAARRYPPGSVGAAFQAYIRTPEWSARAASARMKVWWPAWFRIRNMWGDVAPDTISFEQMSKWRAALENKHGRGVAHKTIRVWRTFWKIMLGMKIARTADPTLGIRNRAPSPRWQRWSEGESVRLVKGAWRHGYKGLACIIAVSWDTQFSPVDVLGDDFAAVRELVFPGDARRLMDMRRSGVVEAIAGDVGPLGLSAKLANSIERSNMLHKTYAPLDIEAVRNADAARLKGRKRIRAGERKRGKSINSTA